MLSMMRPSAPLPPPPTPPFPPYLGSDAVGTAPWKTQSPKRFLIESRFFWVAPAILCRESFISCKKFGTRKEVRHGVLYNLWSAG